MGNDLIKTRAGEESQSSRHLCEVQNKPASLCIVAGEDGASSAAPKE